MSKVRVRFAPSPTGHLHIGGVRTAIFNWLYARHFHGTFLIRIEDTDVQRSTKEYLNSQLASLKWMDLEPDELLVYQMSRIEQHRHNASQLMQAGYAYPCFCVARDAQDVVEQLEQGVGQKYDGACRNKPWTQQDLQKPHAIRFKIPADCQTIEFTDAIRGLISIKVEQLDDFVIMRQDGTPIYNFCVVVDDIAMQITHVIRGEDHISNTFKQILLYHALGASCPVFAHLPLILGKSGNKLSKRDAAVSVEEYRQQGFMPEALSNYLVRLGWSHGDQEIFTRDQLVQMFLLDDVGKKGAIFDTAKLEWLNGVYIRNASCKRIMECIQQMDEKKAQEVQQLWPEEGLLDRLIELYKQRVITLKQLCEDIIAFARDPKSYDVGLIAKWRSDHTKKMLHDFVAILEVTGSADHTVLLEQAKEICEQFQEKLVSLAQPLRLAMTGGIQSPGVFELLQVLGAKRALTRISALLEQL
ncbi:MAG: glutamate--tRNA ligase [bacterium]